jgi:rhodanese-related sulfurtransferase
MRIWWAFITSITFFSSCNGWKHNIHFDYYELKCAEFQNKLINSKEKFTLIDVRTEREYNKSHISGAINISYFGRDFNSKIDSVEKSNPVFIYCHTQHRSPYAARVMKKKGFKTVYDLKGGFIRWENKNFPITK